MLYEKAFYRFDTEITKFLSPEKIPSMGEVRIFSGITQYENRIGLQKQLHCTWSVEVGNITRETLK